MKRIAFYGKGGIGKSTTAANISAAMALTGASVWQIGCDPKNDSTRLLLGGICQTPVLEKLRREGEKFTVTDCILTGFAGVRCVEAGGPEPGVGCAGRGIIMALERLEHAQCIQKTDTVLYDVLGDVVCGGFAMPIREGYAQEVYLISSGELMSLYAANNIAKGIRRFAANGSVRLGGVIGNGRNVPGEEKLLAAFAQRINTKLVAYLPRDPVVNQAEVRRKTVLEWAPQSEQAGRYCDLAEQILHNGSLSIPEPLQFEALEQLCAAFTKEK